MFSQFKQNSFSDVRLERKRRLQKTLKFFAVTAAFLLLASITLVFDIKPFNINTSPLNHEESKLAEGFIKRISKQIINTRKPVTLNASTKEIGATMRFISTTFPRYLAKAEYRDDSLIFYSSIKLQLLGFNFHLNSSTALKSNSTHLQWQYLKIGALTLNESLANAIFTFGTKKVLGKEYGQGVIQGLSDIKVKPNSLALTFEPNSEFHRGLSEALKRLGKLSGFEPNFNSERIQYYVKFLGSIYTSANSNKVSLASILKPLLDEARKQSTNQNQSALIENQSALFALAVHMSGGDFKHFISDIELDQQAMSAAPVITLENRSDLGKHFVYSIALKILSDTGLSLSLGETKEIIDLGKGGSGFSFIDIAADKAGIRFADIATRSEESALATQAFFEYRIKENDFFPDTSKLPENLSQTDFKSSFSATDSKNYRDLLLEIDKLIQRCPLYQHADQN